MNLSALPLVCGRYGLVNLCCTPKALKAAANSLDRKGTPLSVSRRDAHAQPRVVRHRVVDGFVLLLLAMHGGEVDARVVVDGHKQPLPAGTLDRVAPVASHSMARSDDAPELLGVDAAFLIAMMQMVCTQDLATGSPEEFCYLQELQNLADLHLAGIQNQAQVEMKAEAAQPISRHRPSRHCQCLLIGWGQQEPMVYGCEQAGYLPRSKEGSGRTAVASCSVLTWKPCILEQLQTPQVDLCNQASGSEAV